MAYKKTLFEEMSKESCWDFDDFLPTIYKAHNGYCVSVKLPSKLYNKWIARVMGNQKFIDKVVEDIRLILEPFLREHKYYLKISWNNYGMSFSCNGDACEIYPTLDGRQYADHNIDGPFQALILFMALSVYLPSMYFALSQLEENKNDLSNWPELAHSTFPSYVTLDPARA